jgi:hypothetical protein
VTVSHGELRGDRGERRGKRPGEERETQTAAGERRVGAIVGRRSEPAARRKGWNRW